MLAVENACSFRILLSQVRVGYLVGHSRYSVERRRGLREGSTLRSNAARIWYTAVTPPRRANLDSSTLTDDIATVAHHFWCKRIPRQGWRPGKLLDVVARIHDAPRPYLVVGSEDQGRLRLALTCDECEEELVGTVGIALGNRELSARDFRVENRVWMVGGDPDDIGTIHTLSPVESEPDVPDTNAVEWPNSEVVE